MLVSVGSITDFFSEIVLKKRKKVCKKMLRDCTKHTHELIIICIK